MIITILYLCQFACIDSDEDNQIPWISIYFARSAYYHRQKRRKWAITSNANDISAAFLGMKSYVLCRSVLVRASVCVPTSVTILGLHMIIYCRAKQDRLGVYKWDGMFLLDVPHYNNILHSWSIIISKMAVKILSFLLSLSLSLFLSLSLPHTRAIKGSPQ